MHDATEKGGNERVLDFTGTIECYTIRLGVGLRSGHKLINMTLRALSLLVLLNEPGASTE